MRDRKIRTVIVFAAIAGTFITSVTVGLYVSKLQPAVLVGIYLLYTVIQIRTAPWIYKTIYESKFVDIPKPLRKLFPPLGYGYLCGADLKNKFDVILVRPPSAVLSGPDCGEALGIGYLANMLRDEGYSVLVIDARLLGLDTMQTVELLMMYETPMLGINLNFQYLATSTEQMINALRARRYSSHITLGGLFASVAAKKLMELVPGIDTVVRFEGENTYAELVKNFQHPEAWFRINGLVYRELNGKIQINPLRPLISNLNRITIPARDYLPITVRLGGYGYVSSSRGCNGICSYCVQQRSVTDPTGQRWRGREPELVVDEIEQMTKLYECKKISFIDDDFIGPRKGEQSHAYKIAQEIIKRNLDLSILISIQPRDVETQLFMTLRAAGVDSAILAVDNFSQSVLDRYHKLTTVEQNIKSISILNELKIDAYLGIIMFDPWTTLDELETNFLILPTLPFLRPWQILSKLELYDGSSVTQELEKLDLVKWQNFSPRYDYIDPRITGVYQAIEIIMKILHPSMMELDKFRFGSLNYSYPDQLIIDNHSSKLFELNYSFGQDVMYMALEIVKRQKMSDTPVPSSDLADSKLQRKGEMLNEQTLREISRLRKYVVEQVELNEVELQAIS
jgi:radical SAM superfamily enzyme YgiQ (UPF0313 family)